MQRIDYSGPETLLWLERWARGSEERADETRASVATLLKEVRTRGDAAVFELARRFDKAELNASNLRVPEYELASATKLLGRSARNALEASIEGVTKFHKRTLPKDWSARNPNGATVGERFYPISRVGLYIPGGQVPLVSTVVMSAVLAKVAGCPEVVACSPCGPDGKIAPALLAALHMTGVREVYRIGGVQAIGAMAYGTESIRAVDKIFGPGNAYVVEAKRQVFGTVGIDLLPGPSEVMVIADEKAEPEWVAADLLAQAEHGSGRERVCLVVLSAGKLAAILDALESQLAQLPREEATRRVIREGAVALVVPDLATAAAAANAMAPEHLELEVEERHHHKLLKLITRAGAIMLGGWSPTAVADFVAGPSHTLPTATAARFSSGLRVMDFLRRSSVVRYDRKSLERALPAVRTFGAMESLAGHARSLEVRFRTQGRRKKG